MKNEMTRLRRHKNFTPMEQRPRFLAQEKIIIRNQEKRLINDGRNEEQRPISP
jgi:hypothetical protein